MARLLDNPMSVLLILLAVMLLFGAPKLPGMARSLGQSMRILKSEVKELKDEEHAGATTRDADPHPARTADHSTAAQETNASPQDPEGVVQSRLGGLA